MAGREWWVAPQAAHDRGARMHTGNRPGAARWVKAMGPCPCADCLGPTSANQPFDLEEARR